MLLTTYMHNSDDTTKSHRGANVSGRAGRNRQWKSGAQPSVEERGATVSGRAGRNRQWKSGAQPSVEERGATVSGRAGRNRQWKSGAQPSVDDPYECRVLYRTSISFSKKLVGVSLFGVHSLAVL